MIGKTISHYKILGKLGEGGMGIVYRAEDLVLKREVALKFLPVHALDDAEQQARLMREAQAAAALEHININTVYEIDEVDGQTFIAMAYVRGETLKEKIKAGPLPVDEALSLVIQMAAGLNKAHSQGIVHRDIKPANVLVTEEGIVKIVDFGLAKLSGATGLTKTDSTIGTAAYMSPEQAQGQVVDLRTDIWSLGVILYEMLTGTRPFRGEHEAMVAYSILHEDYTPLRSEREDIPEALERIVTKALSKKPSDRYESVGQMLLELRELRGETPADITGSLSKRPRVTVSRQAIWRQPKMVAGAGVAALAVIVSAFLLFRSPGSDTEEMEGRELSTDTLLSATVADSIGRVGALSSDSGGEIADSIAGDTLGIPTLAVLCFENLSGDQKEEYFVTGLTQDMIGEMGCISGLRVLPLDDVMPYRDRSAGILKIGAALNADFLLNASARRGKGDLHIDAQLVKVDDGTLVWNERFDRTLQDIFTVRAEAASAMAAAMNVELLPGERERLLRVPTRDMEAFDLYLRGRVLSIGHTARDNDEAEKVLRRALKRDPDFAVVMVALANLYLERISQAWDLDPKWMTAATELLDQARPLDPVSAELLIALTMKHQLSGEFERALETAKQFAATHPHDHFAHLRLGMAFYFNARPAEARKELDSALSLEPDFGSAHAWLCRIAHEAGKTTEAKQRLTAAVGAGLADPEIQAFAGEYSLARGQIAQAITYFETAIGLKPGTSSFSGQLGIARLLSGNALDAITLLKEATTKSMQPRFHWYLGWAYRSAGQEKDAKRAFEKCAEVSEVALTINPKDLEVAYRSAWARHLAGGTKPGQSELDRLETASLVSSNPSVKPYCAAGILAFAGETEKAVEQLRRLIKLNYYAIEYLAADPALASLHDNAESRKLLGLQDQN